MERRDWIVKKSEWSDKQLEELLRQMPKLQDHRNPRDIYQNLSIKKRRRPVWLVPSLATAAALLLFFLLVPKLMEGTQTSLDSVKQEGSSSEEKISLSKDNASISIKKEDAAETENEISGAEPKMQMSDNDKTALYDDEVENGMVLTYWIPDSQAQILVPISTVVHPDDNKNWLTISTESMALLKEEEWGLAEYYPLNATFELDKINNTVVVDVPNDHQYGQGSAAETNFINILKKNISSNSQVNKIKLTTNGLPGIELGNYGVMEEIEVKPEGKHAYFFFTPDGLDTTYLVPSTDTYDDINTALEAMKTDQDMYGFAASLVPSFPLKEVSIEDNQLFITLDETKAMENNLESVNSLEAILLTAKEFNIESITITNPSIKLLGSFDLTKEIKVPIAANHLQIQ